MDKAVRFIALLHGGLPPRYGGLRLASSTATDCDDRLVDVFAFDAEAEKPIDEILRDTQHLMPVLRYRKTSSCSTLGGGTGWAAGTDAASLRLLQMVLRVNMVRIWRGAVSQHDCSPTRTVMSP